MSAPRSRASPSNAAFPTPASPRMTRTPLRDSRAPSRSPPMIERSGSLPYSNASIVDLPTARAAIWPMRWHSDARDPDDTLTRIQNDNPGGLLETSGLNTPDPRRWWALALLCGAFFMVILDATIVLVALPSIGAD